MPKFSYSFGVAIGIHIIVLLLSTFMLRQKDTPAFNSRNLIDVQFGNGANHLSAKSAEKTPPQKKFTDKKSIALSSPSTTTTITSSESETAAASGVSSEAGPGNFEASVVSYQGPQYPRMAQVRGLQGNVRIRIKISEEGLPQETFLLKSSGHDILDRAALEVIPHWRFQKKGSPYQVEKNIVFELKD